MKRHEEQHEQLEKDAQKVSFYRFRHFYEIRKLEDPKIR